MNDPRRYAAAALLAMGLAATAAAATPELPKYVQGEDYHLVVPVQPTNVRRDQVRVIEFFWYGCPRCYAFEPYLRNWLESTPDTIVFERVPTVASEAKKPQARAFYTAKVIGMLDALHPAIFDEIHKQRHFLRSKKDFRAFFMSHGVTKVQFNRAWNSPEVNKLMRHAAVLGARYRFNNSPTVAVGGKYFTNPSMLKSFPQFIGIINFLTEKVLDNKQ